VITHGCDPICIRQHKGFKHIVLESIYFTVTLNVSIQAEVAEMIIIRNDM